MANRRIKRYELLEEVGRGGMAVVYRGLDTALDREVAVKVLHPHLASRPESSRRFHREARAVAKLRHNNIVEIFDTSGDDDTDEKFIVTEFVDGGTLRDLVEDHGIAFPEVGAAIVIELCDALEHAHEHGIIHRDIKPENAMLTCEGRVKLMDFGIAQVLDADRMTASGSLLGSPAHMAPEIIDGASADFRADIFSLGTVLYYVTTNALPFEGSSPTSVLRNIMEARYLEPQMRNPKIGRKLSGVIKRAMETEPEQRYDDIGALRAALVDVLDEVRVEDSGALAGEYIRDPEAFAERFEPELVDRLVARAEVACQDRDVAAATDTINRVLAYEPEHERAHELLDELGSRRRVRLAAMIAAACVVLGGAGWWLATLAQDDAAEQATSATDTTETAERRASATPVEPDVTPPEIRAAAGMLVARAVESGLEGARLRPTDAWMATPMRRASVGGFVAGVWTRARHSPVRVARHTPRDDETDEHDGRSNPDDTAGEHDVTEGQDATDGTPRDGGGPLDVVSPPEPLEPPQATFVVQVNHRAIFARVNNEPERYGDESGRAIEIPLAAGTYSITLDSRMHEPKTVSAVVSKSAAEAGRIVRANQGQLVVLELSPGRVTIPRRYKDTGYYFLFQVDGERIDYIHPGQSEVIPADQFDELKTEPEVEVTVWRVPGGVSLEGMPTRAALRRYDRDTLQVSPGERAQPDFDFD